MELCLDSIHPNQLRKKLTLPRIYMTTNAPWCPYSDSFAEAEARSHRAARVTIHHSDLWSQAAASQDRVIAAVRCYDLITADPFIADEGEDDLYH